MVQRRLPGLRLESGRLRGTVVGAARVPLTRGCLGAGEFGRASILILALAISIGPGGAAALRGQSFIGSGRIKPFVTSVVPVVGGFGAVGGVSIDAQGVVSRAQADKLRAELQTEGLKSRGPVPAEWQQFSPLRMVSLAELDAALGRCVDANEPLPDELFLLAGLQRVEYIFGLPDQRDIVIAGPAEGWRVGRDGEVVGALTGAPALRLDDLLVAVQTARFAASGQGITCSIDPSAEGLARLTRLLRARDAIFNRATARRMEEAVGPQQVRITGVPADSHFAGVLVAADFMMKRLAMGFEPSAVPGLTPYLEMLAARGGRATQLAAPRWWLAVNYLPLLHSPDRLNWQLRGQGVAALTEDGYLNRGGDVVASERANPLAERWARRFTNEYVELSERFPVFGALRNCMDLAVVAALLTKEDLVERSGCTLSSLLDPTRTRGPVYHVPQTVASQASFVRSHRGWIVSISGGVDVDSWSVLDHIQQAPDLAPPRMPPANLPRWWWDAKPVAESASLHAAQ
jgi:hypothetical protein